MSILKFDVFFTILVGTIILHQYLKTISPSIAGGDSGELVAEGCIFGTAHPPGYPLFTIITHFLSRLKYFSIVSSSSESISIAYMVNITSAIYTTLACFLIGRTIILFTKSLKYSELSYTNAMSGTMMCCGTGFAMLLFAFSPLIWQYATTSEVFPMNTMFAGLLLYLTAEFSISHNITTAILGALVCGLALCNQHTIILYEVPLILWMLFLLRRKIMSNYYLLLYLGMAFMLGLSCYLYFPISSYLNESLKERYALSGSWGHVKTISGLLHHILRKDYGTFQLFSGASGKRSEGFTKRNEAYLQDIFTTQGLYIVPILAIVGAFLPLLVNLYRTCESFNLTLKSIDNQPTMNKKLKKKTTNTRIIPSSLQSSSSIESPPQPLIDPYECSHTPTIFIITQLFYFGIFHSLANLPLGDKLLYGVHQRFWIQPNVLLFIWSGIGFNYLLYGLHYLVQMTITKKDANPSSKIDPTIPTTSSPTRLPVLFVWIGFLLAMYCAIKQHQGWIYRMDSSDAFYFHDYATALLAPLPPHSILIINYDQHWTSIRYLQNCEGVRSDVTTINLSMMSYQWFQHKRSLFPNNITFPGTFLTYPRSPSLSTLNAFTLHQFLNENIPKHSIFFAGKISYPDEEMNQRYELVPIGLVAQFLPIDNHPYNNGSEYLKVNVKSSNLVFQSIKKFPNSEKYPDDTWEWTIGRDFKDRVIDTASFMLSVALNVASHDYQPLIESVYWLESAIIMEGLVNCPSSLLKNAGLAHVHLMQNKLLDKKSSLPVPYADRFQTMEFINWPKKVTKIKNKPGSWKTWSSNKFALYWGEFIQRPDAIHDPQYATIREMYRKATGK